MTAHRPRPFETHTTAQLWTDPHISKQMLEFHLDPESDPASRPHDFVGRSAEWICQRFEIGPGTRVCDFGCGPGLYTTAFAKHGAHVVGVDFSERSLNHARQTAAESGLTIDYVHQDYLAFTSDHTFDLATLIYCDFGALSDKHRRTLLLNIKEVLDDRGALLLDVFSDVLFNTSSEQQSDEFCAEGGFWSAEPYRVVQTTHKYDEELLLLDHYLIEQPSSNREIFNWVQCFTPATLFAELEAAGFHVIDHYANVAGDPYIPESREIAVVAVVK